MTEHEKKAREMNFDYLAVQIVQNISGPKGCEDHPGWDEAVEHNIQVIATALEEAVKAENDRCVLILETMSTDADNRAEFAIGDALERGVGAIRARGG